MMTSRLVRAAFIAFLAPIAAIVLQAEEPGVLQQRRVPALAAQPPMLGIHWARGEAGKARPGGGSSPNMTSHGGAIMPTVFIQAIFWGPGWSDSTFVADKFTGLATWHGGLNGNSFTDTSDEYSGTNGQVTSTIHYDRSFVDLSPVPSTVSKLTTPTFNEVCSVIGSNGTLVSNGYYPVYVDLKRGNAGFCAYHSYGTCNNVPVQFAFFFNLDGDAGCDTQDSATIHSQGLEALVNVSAHEFSEARTDPRSGGWYDNSGAENADKCAWRFGTDSILVGGQQWKMQGNWSNGAYNTGTGYANSSGQKGCIVGGNFK
jgi:hypothetical protein